jgi:hypothetical protein
MATIFPRLSPARAYWGPPAPTLRVAPLPPPQPGEGIFGGHRPPRAAVRPVPRRSPARADLGALPTRLLRNAPPPLFVGWRGNAEPGALPLYACRGTRPYKGRAK